MPKPAENSVKDCFCGAGDSCAECFGSGAEPDGPAGSCVGCCGTCEEPRLLPSCSEECCGVPLPGAGG